MKRTVRRVAIATKNASRKLLWFGATIAAPASGMCSAPEMRTRNHTRKTPATKKRTTE